MEEISRNQLQVIIMTALYDCLTCIYMEREIDIEDILSSLSKQPYELVDIFAKEVVIKAIRNYDEIIKTVQDKMPDWKFERKNRLMQAIFLLAVSEYKYVGGIDKKIVINVSVELAKKYLDSNDYKFVNAVLDKAL